MYFSSIANKAKLGCFKDETAGQTLEEMVLLRPKMYSMKYKDLDISIKRAKGICRHIVKNMKHEQFKEAFEEKKITRVNMSILRSKHHKIKTTTLNKRALSAWEEVLVEWELFASVCTRGLLRAHTEATTCDGACVRWCGWVNFLVSLPLPLRTVFSFVLFSICIKPVSYTHLTLPTILLV